MSKTYVYSADEPEVGRDYYLIEHDNPQDGRYYRLSNDIPVTVPGDKEKETGFLGSHNNHSRHSLGKVKIVFSKREGDARNNKWIIKYE